MNDSTSEMKSARELSEIVELRRSSHAGIVAIIYRGGRQRQTIPLTDGTIVERPRPEQRREVPQSLETCIGITAGSVPATIHHLNLGLVIDHLTLGGIYVLPSGEVAAVYGAQANALG